jgi:hypothetical protein
MKRFFWIAAILVFCFAGCNNGNVVSVHKDKFPSFLAGEWKSDDDKWAFTFEPDGSISTFRHFFISIPIKVEEGGAYEELKENSYGIYVLGPCFAEYNSQKRILNVEINIAHFEVVLPIGTGEGSMKDTFRGIVSEDGMLWNAEWINYAEFVDAEKPDPNSITPEPLVFRHIK